MTKKEIEKIAKAISLLHDNDECYYDQALEILCDLIGRKYPKFGTLKAVSVSELYESLNKDQ